MTKYELKRKSLKRMIAAFTISSVILGVVLWGAVFVIAHHMMVAE